MWFTKYVSIFFVFTCKMQMSAGQNPGVRPRRSPYTRGARIVQGHPASPDEVPWNLYLLYGNDFLCSATLVQSVATKFHFALTSARCLKPQNGVPIDEKQLTVVAGVIDRTFRNEPHKEIGSVREVIRHPTYEKQDVAFLLLDQQFTENVNFVFPVALPTKPDFYPKDYAPLKVAGWGSSVRGDNAHRSEVLQVKVIETCSLSDCKVVHSFDWGGGEVLDTALCAWDTASEGYNGACNGDQGTAAVTDDKETEFPYIAGVLSWVHGKCGDNKLPSVFVRVSAVLNWILEVDKKYASEYDKKP